MSSPQPLLRKMRQTSSGLGTDGLLACILLLVAIAVLIGGALRASQAVEERADAAASRIAAVVAQDVARSMEQFDLTLQAVISRHQSPAVQNLSAQSRSSALFDRAQRDPSFSFLNVLDASGGFVAGLPQNESNWAERDYFIELRTHPLSGPYVGR